METWRNTKEVTPADSMINIKRTNHCPGLAVLRINSPYIFTYSAIHSIGTFVVNIGDVIEAWTKGKFRATVHRVRSSTRDHRISAPFFFHPGLDCIIESLDDVLGIDRCPEDLGKTAHTVLSLHELFKFGDYVLNKFQKSYGMEM